MACNFQEGGGQVLAFYQSRDSNLQAADAVSTCSRTPCVCLYTPPLRKFSLQGGKVSAHQQVSTMTEHLTDTRPSVRVHRWQKVKSTTSGRNKESGNMSTVVPWRHGRASNRTVTTPRFNVSRKITGQWSVGWAVTAELKLAWKCFNSYAVIWTSSPPQTFRLTSLLQNQHLKAQEVTFWRE